MGFGKLDSLLKPLTACCAPTVPGRPCWRSPGRLEHNMQPAAWMVNPAVSHPIQSHPSLPLNRALIVQPIHVPHGWWKRTPSPLWHYMLSRGERYTCSFYAYASACKIHTFKLGGEEEGLQKNRVGICGAILKFTSEFQGRVQFYVGRESRTRTFKRQISVSYIQLCFWV